ncbi:MAG: hypothetical protein JSS79_12310 [Bacteroidetes bacterium]|nr:hypothetical protein [Bacteroidota bacterium]
MGSILGDIICAGIGWICLFVWYRDLDKMEDVKNKEYAGQYSYVGRVMILNFIAGVGAIMMFGFALLVLVMWIYRSIKGLK